MIAEPAQVPDNPDRKRIGELLAERSHLDMKIIDRALKLQAENGERLGQLLLQLGMISERDLADVLGLQLGLPVLATDDYPQALVLDTALTPEFLRNARAVPIGLEQQCVQVAVADPLDQYTVDALAMALGREIQLRVGTGADIESAIARLYGEGAGQMEQIVEGYQGAEDRQEADDIQQLRDLASEAPIIRLVNIIISRALEVHASDIHIEPFADRLTVRYRVDGVLQDAESPPTRSTAAVVSRIKVMANLNIAERRLPQDGRIRLRLQGREIDLRISTVPTLYGESVVLRILDKGSLALDFQVLGFRDKTLAALHAMLAKPYGIILVTGPTGSGKTTTLYAALNHLNSPDRKILTVEDPVEYQLTGINQIQVKPAIGLSFANALRSILRQDPDVIMVGEMRDVETAKIAVQAALTGHKVFSTLHTNDAASSILRLLDMGVEDYLVSSTLNGVIAQRLVRTLCESCREPRQVAPELAAELGLVALSVTAKPIFYHPVGCSTCHGAGYRGRCSIIEILPMSDALGRTILGHRDAARIRQVARDQGLAGMREDGLAKVLAGLTSLEEVELATGEL